MLSWQLQCQHSCQYFVLALISYLFNFPLLRFHFLFFYSITFFYFIFVLCWQLQCQHSCQYFVWTLISFLISFSITSFSISIFVFNNFILYYFYCCVDNCNVNTHAKNIPSLCVHMYCAQGPDQFSVHSLHCTDDARTTARNWRINQSDCQKNETLRTSLHRYTTTPIQRWRSCQNSWWTVWVMCLH